MKTLVGSGPREFIGIPVTVEGGIHRWCNKEVSKLRQYVEENEQNWTNRRADDVKLGLDRPDVSKIIPNLQCVPCSQGTYFIPSETRAEVI